MKRAVVTKKPVDVRREAQRILLKLGDASTGWFAADLIDDLDMREDLSPRDRRFLTELTYGVLRHRLTLDAVIASYSRVALDALEPNVLQTLRLALYQLIYLDGIPPFAAVSSSVELLASRPHLRNFANGILRTVVREMTKLPLESVGGQVSASRRLPRDGKVAVFERAVVVEPDENPDLHLAQVTSHPIALVSRWVSRYGREGAERLLRHGNQRPELTVRVNLCKGTLPMAQELLRRGGVESEAFSERGLRIRGGAAELIKSAAFQQGWVSVQGGFAQEAVPFLDPRPGARCVDLCAAPGGKTMHVAEHTRDGAFVLACDTALGRLARVRDNARRLGLSSVRSLVLDGTGALPLSTPFDHVLVDAPCSNTAVLARRPEARWRFSDESLASLGSLQQQLLVRAAGAVAPRGRLLYSTCSLEPEENATQVQAFLERQPEFALLGEKTALPGEQSDDGGYLALLERRA